MVWSSTQVNSVSIVDTSTSRRMHSTPEQTGEILSRLALMTLVFCFTVRPVDSLTPERRPTSVYSRRLPASREFSSCLPEACHFASSWYVTGRGAACPSPPPRPRWLQGCPSLSGLQHRRSRRSPGSGWRAGGHPRSRSTWGRSSFSPLR